MAISLSVALGLVPLYKAKEKSSSEFSAYRVADDIRVISKEPHSIQHPNERKVLRDFLFYRLQQMGGDTQILEYDTIPAKIGGKFSYSNIYSVFPAKEKADSLETDTSQSYLLLVAHYDSRFRTKVGKDTVFSFGAADDGYGLGVILELVNQALVYRDEWKQGIKVLFTDAEEHNLDGMRSAYARDSFVFENVNFVVNVEARGVKGPALLFETSSGNDKLMELYSWAENPHGMSLTTAVYKFLPNDTDFSVVKDSIPGLNFAVIDNLHYYHTDKDNYSNISLKSVQHYGDQLEPVIKKYLTGEEYGDKGALLGEEDVVFFALPVLGLFVFSKTGYLVLNVLFYALFLFVAYIYVRYKVLRFSGILKAFKHLLVSLAAVLLLGFGAAYVSALQTGLEFDLIGLKYVPYDDKLVVFITSGVFALALLFVRLQEKNDKFYAWKMLLAVQFLMMLLSMTLLVVFGENFFLFIPFAVATAALFFGIAKNFKWIYLISCSITLLVGAYFLYLIYMALTLGSFGIILFVGIIYIYLIISQYYCMKRSVL